MINDDDYDEHFEDEHELLDCPNCNRTYNDADADFLICSRCGYNAETSKFNMRTKSTSLKGFGIDPDVEMDNWH